MTEDDDNANVFLSPEDAQLFEAEPKIKAGDSPPLEAEADLTASFRRIVDRYDETPKGGMKAGHKPHLDCAFRCHAKHWRGFLVELDNDKVVRVGKDCGHRHFKEDFQRGFNAYNAEETRKFELERLIALRRTFPTALAELKAHLTSDSVVAYDRYLDTLRRSFGRLSLPLAESVRNSSGHLMAARRVRDSRREEEEAKQADEREARATGRRSRWQAMSHAQTREGRARAVKEWKAFLASRPALWKMSQVDVGSCSGWRVIIPSLMPSPSKLLKEAVEDADAIAEQLRSRNSGDWQTVQIVELKKTLDGLLKNWKLANDSLRELSLFATEDNIKRISVWAQQSEREARSIGQDVVAVGRALVDRDSEAKLALPPSFYVPQTRLLETLATILKRRFELWGPSK